jgi:hypothetical protein
MLFAQLNKLKQPMNAPDKTTRREVLVYEPTADEGKLQEALARRHASLDGKVVGLLDNTKDLADILLDEAKAVLQRDFPGAQFRYFRKESVSGAAPDLMEAVASCDAVITAVGD